MLIKVCGLTDEQQLNEISDFADLTGMIFYPKSPRYLSTPLEGNDGNRVGVFVNETESHIREIAELHALDTIQLHGSESPNLCESLSRDFKIIKAFGIDDRFDFEILKAYFNISLFLFDTQTKEFGGSGRKFNWELLTKYELDVPFLLSGGIGPEHISDITTIDHPQFAGVDLNSKFEKHPGYKDIQKLKDFTHELRYRIHAT